MKTRSLGTSASLLLFGAAIILLIGAFARFDSSAGTASLSAISVVPPAPSLEPADAPPADEAVLPANLSPGLEEIIKLAQAHVGNDVILSFVQNSGRIYHPTSQELLYLTDLGLSQKVLAALYSNTAAPKPEAEFPSTPPAPGPASADFALSPPPPLPDATSPPPPPQSAESLEATAPASPEVAVPSPATIALDAPPLQDPTTSYFFNDLAPYGRWVDLGEQGWFWQPTVVATVAGWQPYRDHGGWAYTESGWYWRSDYSWAWAAFHYGRWLNHPRQGWIWRPGNTWAPAWVAWRNTSEHAGWAALPPGAPLNLGGRSPSAFGLTASSFTFVPFRKFLKPWSEEFAVGPGDLAGVFRASAPANNMSLSGERILNLGVTPSQISSVTHRPVRQFALRDTTLSSVNQIVDRNGIGVYRPVTSGKGAANFNDPRLARLNASAEPPLPDRELPSSTEAHEQVFGAQVPRPSTPPPLLPGMRFLPPAAAGQAVFPPGHFDGRFAPAEFDHPPRPGSPFGAREFEPAINRSAPLEERPAERYERGPEHPIHQDSANSQRPSAPESHSSTPSTSNSKSSGH